MSGERPVIVLRADEPLTPELADRIRAAFDPPEPRWVLVKGCHDSGTVDGVYGPYTEEYADWLLGNVLDGTYSNWTKARLSSGPEAG